MRLPDPEGVAGRLSKKLGRPCLAIEGQAIHFRTRSRALLASYVNDLGGAECLAICEHELAVFLVGALLNEPLDGLQSSLRENRLEAHP